MLDIELLRKEPDKVKKAIATKNADPKLVDEFGKLDHEWRVLTKEADEKRAEQKKLSEKRDVESGKKNKEEIKKLGEKIAALEKRREEVWQKIPNLPSEDTPVGKDESENKVLRQNGKPKKFDFEPKDHLALGESLGLIDVESAGKISGSRFAYLMREAAQLEFALVQYTMETLTNPSVIESVAGGVKKGYHAQPFIPVVPPVMIRPEVFQRMGRLEPREDRYHIPSDDLWLIGSAEHTLGPLHMDQTIPEEKLPIRYLGFSTAFRREAGSYGKDVRGILRVHQFDKLEMESFTLPEDGITEQEFFVAVQENLMWALELPYQVIICCTGDQGDPDARHLDIETWIPSQKKYRETHSADYMSDYQARRLGTRVRRKDGKTEFVHMNDATAFAIGRTLIAIMENYQTKDGKIEVPKVLQKYVGKTVIG
ncbi:MAG TPA: serine--tRNA ligase [Candidatus Paceibacterota bacterium]|jgi:seryl-tRNA synthetase|nr:serine--tRNA ligase [Candidatus Paceibacterota bacterium]